MTVSDQEKIVRMYTRDFQRAARKAFGRGGGEVVLAHLQRKEYMIVDRLVNLEYKTAEASSSVYPSKAWRRNYRIQKRFSRANKLLTTWRCLGTALNLNNLP